MSGAMLRKRSIAPEQHAHETDEKKKNNEPNGDQSCPPGSRGSLMMSQTQNATSAMKTAISSASIMASETAPARRRGASQDRGGFYRQP